MGISVKNIYTIIALLSVVAFIASIDGITLNNIQYSNPISIFGIGLAVASLLVSLKVILTKDKPTLRPQPAAPPRQQQPSEPFAPINAPALGDLLESAEVSESVEEVPAPNYDKYYDLATENERRKASFYSQQQMPEPTDEEYNGLQQSMQHVVKSQVSNSKQVTSALPTISPKQQTPPTSKQEKPNPLGSLNRIESPPTTELESAAGSTYYAEGIPQIKYMTKKVLRGFNTTHQKFIESLSPKKLSILGVTLKMRKNDENTAPVHEINKHIVEESPADVWLRQQIEQAKRGKSKQTEE